MKSTFKKKLIATLIPLIGMPLAASSLAQSGTPSSTSQSSAGASQQQSASAQQAMKIRDHRASKVIGSKVESAEGKDLGEIRDMIVDADAGQVEYAIVAFGGTLGFGEKLFAYPVSRLKAGSSSEKLVLNASEEEMKNAPGFDKSSMPSWGSGGYRGEVDKHFGQTVKTGGNLVRMSEMLDTKVVDRAGNEVGEVNDVVVSVADGKVRYLALEPVDDLNMKDKLAMLPMEAIRATGEKRFESQQAGQSTQQAQESQPGQPPSAMPQPERRESQPGQPPSAMQQQDRQERQQQQAQSRDQDLVLVLNVPPKQLQQAKTIQKDQWPDLNTAEFRREMDSYVASFPSGGQSATGASGTQGEQSSGAGKSSDKPSGSSGSSSGGSSGSSSDKSPGSSDSTMKSSPEKSSGSSMTSGASSGSSDSATSGSSSMQSSPEKSSGSSMSSGASSGSSDSATQQSGGSSMQSSPEKSSGSSMTGAGSSASDTSASQPSQSKPEEKPSR